MIFTIGLASLLLFILLGLPIGFALGIAGIASLSMLLPVNSILALMTMVVHDNAASYLLLSIPMFVLMAEFLSAGGVAQDLLLACNHALRRVRGGLAMACILAGTVHAACTGSSTASAASLARASFPAMMRAGYSPSFAVGTIAIAGTLAAMIPPSTSFVLYGLMTETSVGKLFIAGMIPGLLTAAGYIVTISVVLWLRPDLGAKAEKEVEIAASSRERGRVWPMVVLVGLILGGLYLGVATPTEIAALGALGALVMSLAMRRMSRGHFIDSLGTSLRITAMILTVIFGAHVFGYFISFSKVTDVMLSWVAGSELSPTAVMLVVTLFYLILGTFMDQATILILTAPISTALMVGLGYDPVWWGVIMIKTSEIGLVHPPFGMVTIVVSATTRTDLRSNVIGVIPYIITELILLGLLLAYPQISLALVK